MLTKNNSTIQKCIKSKVHSECPPSWSLTCLLFRVTTVNTLEHILPDFFPKGHSYLLYGCLVFLFVFFFSKLGSHKASSPGTCWLPFFHERICHKLLICSCLSGGTWMESPGLFNVPLSGVRTLQLLCRVRC